MENVGRYNVTGGGTSSMRRGVDREGSTVHHQFEQFSACKIHIFSSCTGLCNKINMVFFFFCSGDVLHEVAPASPTEPFDWHSGSYSCDDREAVLGGKELLGSSSAM